MALCDVSVYLRFVVSQFGIWAFYQEMFNRFVFVAIAHFAKEVFRVVIVVVVVSCFRGQRVG